MKTHRNIFAWLLKGATLLLIAVGAVVLLSAVKTKDAKPCKSIEISRAGDKSQGFVTNKQITDIIGRQLGSDPIGTALYQFDLGKIETELERNAWIADVQMYFDNNQILHISLQEALPVARIFDDAGKSFYLDTLLQELPLSATYRADLPVFTQVPVKRTAPAAKDLLKRISYLAVAITADSFWLAQAAQIEVISDGRFEMIPLIGNHVVDLDKAEEPVDVLNRLKAFYKAMSKAGRLNDYRVIKAGFKGQIVAQLHQEAENFAAQKAVLEQFKKVVSDNKKEVNEASVTNENIGGRVVEDAPRAATSTNKPQQQSTTAPAKQQVKEEVQKNSAEQEKAGIDQNELKQTAAPATDKKETGKPAEQIKEKKTPKAVMPKFDKN